MIHNSKPMKDIKYIIIAIATIALMASFIIHAQDLPSISQITKPISQMTISEIKAEIQEIIAVVQQLQTLLAKLTPEEPDHT